MTDTPETETDTKAVRAHLSIKPETRSAIDRVRIEIRRRGTQNLPLSVAGVIENQEWTADTIVDAGCASLLHLLTTQPCQFSDGVERVIAAERGADESRLQTVERIVLAWNKRLTEQAHKGSKR